jgi:hypothetical protein
MREKRQQPRYACAGTAEIHFPCIGKSCHARVEDLSLTGCRLAILSQSPIELRSIFELAFTVRRMHFRVLARATGMRGVGRVGVEFVGLTLSTTRYLHDLMDELEAARKTLGVR